MKNSAELKVPALRVRIRSLSYCGRVTLLDSVNFDLMDGECLGVIGPNGSGKTSLLRALSLELRAEGEITLYGRSLFTLNAQQRAKQIAVMAQHDAPDLRLSIEDYVALGRIPFAREMTEQAHRNIINGALRDTGLQSLRRKSLAFLSGGEKQRASLARTLAQTPRLLLLDEPTNHLDLPAREELLSLIKRRGIMVVAVLHELNTIEDFAHRVLMLSAGRQMTFDTPEQALGSEFLRPVFGLNSFTVAHPHKRGKNLRIFESSH
ncbi:ABC transporter ATP-binding protein [Dryocola sp. BD613]|uniref:ABC transporter ATP-binding protein n=1 Tax=Dryocola sp. BD613 TaxID=3133272 RepID=UPI003F501B91